MSRENLVSRFPTRSDTNQALKLQMARGLKFGFRKLRDCTIFVAKTKVPINCTVTMRLICAYVFTYANSRFSHDMAQIISENSKFLSFIFYPIIFSSAQVNYC